MNKRFPGDCDCAASARVKVEIRRNEVLERANANLRKQVSNSREQASYWRREAGRLRRQLAEGESSDVLALHAEKITRLEQRVAFLIGQRDLEMTVRGKVA